MKRLIKKRWLLPWIAGVSVIFSVAGVMQVIAQPNSGNPLATPLSPNDPAAKLDKKLWRVPPMPESKENNPQKYPLSPTDPAAKLDERLLNVPPVPEAKIDSSSSSNNSDLTVREEVYDVKTGTVKVGASKLVKSDSKTPKVSPPFAGSN